MQRGIRGRAKKAGLPPGSMIYVGDRKSGEVKVTVTDYAEDTLTERVLTDVNECIAYRNKPTVTWVDVEGVHKTDILEKIGSCFDLHPLVVEDILNTDQRAKYEDYGSYIYLVLKMLRFDAKTRTVVPEQVSVVFGQNYILSFQEGVEGDAFNQVRDRIRSNKGRIRKMGPDYLAYSLLDAIVDNYFIALEGFGERIESLEDQLVTAPSNQTLRTIHELKRDMLFLRRAIWPLREVLSALSRDDSTLMNEVTRLYLRDVYDHVIHVIDTVETYREMLSGMLDIYLSSVSNRLNAVMKVLTIIATIFMPLTFLAGVYGMNFKHMPELEWQWGYPMLWLVMILIAVAMLIAFRRKKWI